MPQPCPGANSVGIVSIGTSIFLDQGLVGKGRFKLWQCSKMPRWTPTLPLCQFRFDSSFKFRSFSLSLADQSLIKENTCTDAHYAHGVHTRAGLWHSRSRSIMPPPSLADQSLIKENTCTCPWSSLQGRVVGKSPISAIIMPYARRRTCSGLASPLWPRSCRNVHRLFFALE